MRLRRLPAREAMAVSFLMLAAAFPAAWHLWTARRAGNANHAFAVALLFGFWQVLAARVEGLGCAQHGRHPSLQVAAVGKAVAALMTDALSTSQA